MTVALTPESLRTRFAILVRDAGLTDQDMSTRVWTEYSKLRESNKYALDVRLSLGAIIHGESKTLFFFEQGDPIQWLTCIVVALHVSEEKQIDMLNLLKASKVK